MTRFSKLDWALIPGPEEVSEVLDSQGQHDIALYSPGEISRQILSIDGTRLLNAGADWWEWRASYESDSDIFELTMTLFDIEPIAWGGCGIVACSDPTALLQFWQQLRKSHPRIWLHNSECAIFNPSDFQKMYVR